MILNRSRSRRFGRARPSPAMLDELRYAAHGGVGRRSPSRDKQRCHLSARPPPVVRLAAAVVARRTVVSSFTSGINRGWFARVSVWWWSPCGLCRVVAQYNRSRATASSAIIVAVTSSPAVAVYVSQERKRARSRALSFAATGIEFVSPRRPPRFVHARTLRICGASRRVARAAFYHPIAGQSRVTIARSDVTSHCDVTHVGSLIEKCTDTRARTQTRT